MIRCTPRYILILTRFPYTTLFRSVKDVRAKSPEECGKLAQELLVLAQKEKNVHAEAIAYLYMSTSAVVLKEVQEGIQYGLLSLEIQKEHGFTEYLSQQYNILGLAYYGMNQEQLAVNYFNKAMEQAKENNDPLGEIMSLNNISHIFNELHKYEKSIEYLKQACYQYEVTNWDGMRRRSEENTSELQ